ncbi:MAG: hypothetical protein OSJ53_11630 [Kineothrix sp.]|nr:hypothetical protein [Kineothrix sp.]
MAGRVQTAGERAGGDGTGKDRQRRDGTGGAWISAALRREIRFS